MTGLSKSGIGGLGLNYNLEFLFSVLALRFWSYLRQWFSRQYLTLSYLFVQHNNNSRPLLTYKTSTSRRKLQRQNIVAISRYYYYQ